MSQAIQRLIEKAMAQQHKTRPPDALLILCDRPEDLPRRVDVLIRAGKLTEADRPRCVFCEDDELVAMTHDERVFLWDANEAADRSYREAEYASPDNDDWDLDDIFGPAEKREK